MLKNMLMMKPTKKLPLCKNLKLPRIFETLFEPSDMVDIPFLSIQLYHALFRPLPPTSASVLEGIL